MAGEGGGFLGTGGSPQGREVGGEESTGDTCVEVALWGPSRSAPVPPESPGAPEGPVGALRLLRDESPWACEEVPTLQDGPGSAPPLEGLVPALLVSMGPTFVPDPTRPDTPASPFYTSSLVW